MRQIKLKFRIIQFIDRGKNGLVINKIYEVDEPFKVPIRSNHCIINVFDVFIERTEFIKNATEAFENPHSSNFATYEENELFDNFMDLKSLFFNMEGAFKKKPKVYIMDVDKLLYYGEKGRELIK